MLLDVPYPGRRAKRDATLAITNPQRNSLLCAHVVNSGVPHRNWWNTENRTHSWLERTRRDRLIHLLPCLPGTGPSVRPRPTSHRTCSTSTSHPRRHVRLIPLREVNGNVSNGRLRLLDVTVSHLCELDTGTSMYPSNWPLLDLLPTLSSIGGPTGRKRHHQAHEVME